MEREKRVKGVERREKGKNKQVRQERYGCLLEVGVIRAYALWVLY